MIPVTTTIPLALQKAIRVLLEQPLLLEGTEGFREVIAWRSEVSQFFRGVAGWMVLTGPSVVRLVAPPAFAEAGRALEELHSVKASALLAWILWFHEYLGLRLGEARQFSLSELAAQIEDQSGLVMTSLEHRRALVQAVRALEHLGAMRLLDANTSDWEDAKERAESARSSESAESSRNAGSSASSGGSAGALLEFTAGAAYLISQPVLPSVTALQRAVRALLTGPALHRAQDSAAFSALQDDAELERGMLAQLERTLGWTLEIQPDYALLLRGGVTKGLAKRFTPGRGVVQSAGLLLLNTLRLEVQAQRLTVTDGRLRLTHNQLYALLDQVRADYRDKWGQQANTSTEKLLRAILEEWCSWGAAQQEGEFWWLEALLSRFEAYYHDPTQPPVERAAGKRRRKNS